MLVDLITPAILGLVFATIFMAAGFRMGWDAHKKAPKYQAYIVPVDHKEKLPYRIFHLVFMYKLKV